MLALGSTQRDMENGPPFGDVDLLASKHGVDTLTQAGLLCKLDEQPDRLIGNAVLRIIEVETCCVKREALGALRILSEELAEMYLLDIRVMCLKCLPRRALAERGDDGLRLGVGGHFSFPP